MRIRLLALFAALALLSVACGANTTETVAESSATDPAVSAVEDAAPATADAVVDPVTESGAADAAVAESPAETDPAQDTSEVPAGEPRLVSTVGGGQLDLGSLEGQDTVLWFWAPW